MIRGAGHVDRLGEKYIHGRDSVDWIRPAHITDKWLAFVNTVMNSRDAKNAGDSWLAGKLLASQTRICSV
jgi:hypothetical protein